MAGSAADEMENDLADWIVGRTPSGHSALGAPSTTHYLALFTTTLDDGDATVSDGTEVSGGSYARVAIGASNFGTAASGGTISNDAEIAFATATASWGTVESWAIVEGNTGGTDPILFWCDDPSVAIGDGDTAKFASGELTVTVT